MADTPPNDPISRPFAMIPIIVVLGGLVLLVALDTERSDER
jgi:hypothetical protein